MKANTDLDNQSHRVRAAREDYEFLIAMGESSEQAARRSGLNLETYRGLKAKEAREAKA